MAHENEMAVEFGGSQKTIFSYMLGFALAIILTLLAFGLVEWRILSSTNLYIALGLLAFTQLLVQSLCFLRLNASQEGRENLSPFLFTLLIISIFIGGSLWIMYNLNYNMVN